MRLAARGRRQTYDGEEAIRDPVLARTLRRQAREVHVESLLVGAALTGLALLLPG
ncbi:MAG: hypothetical protein HYS77_01150 [Candidatus Rokubacteria bacterium]|nr:hypothetical protein [Candidatus Rokubacteria bacterium]